MLDSVDEVEEALDRLTELYSALMDLDIEFARQCYPQASNDFVLLASLHKARYERPEIPDNLRHESRLWLQLQGFQRHNSMHWPPQGELPP